MKRLEDLKSMQVILKEQLTRKHDGTDEAYLEKLLDTIDKLDKAIKKEEIAETAYLNRQKQATKTIKETVFVKVLNFLIRRKLKCWIKKQ